MSDSSHLTDRIPDVVLGRTPWSPEEQTHLAGCADCRAELALVQAAGRIGEGLPPLADRAVLTEAVLGRVARAPAVPPRGGALRWAGGVALAAALAIAVWTGSTRSDRSPAGAGGSETAVETLSTAQVDSLLEDDDVPLAGWSMLETPTLGDLDEVELEQLLRTWEG